MTFISDRFCVCSKSNFPRQGGLNRLESYIQTRPDTRPPVPDGWAGAEMRVFPLFNSITSTDQPTDGRTKPLIELRVRN